MIHIWTLLRYIFSIRIFNTIIFNMKAFPFRYALKFPVIIKQKVDIISVGRIVLGDRPKRGMMTVGGVTLKETEKLDF